MLAEIVEALVPPTTGEEVFAARALDCYPGVSVGVDIAGRPAVFFDIRSGGGQRRPFVLASIVYDPSAQCRFDGDESDRRCAVLRCTASERASQDLFLRVVDSWLPTTPNSGVGIEIDCAVARLIDLFDELGRPRSGEVLGLWGELLVILAADDPRELLRAWRCDPFERHDFVATDMRLEVKTSVGVRRHHFSLEQLQVADGARLIVGSIVTKAVSRGLTVYDLCARLLKRVDDPRLAFRVEQTIASTLGDRWSETTSQRYALDLACDTIAFYDGATVPRVDPKLPPEVSQVRFAVELDALPTVAPSVFPGLGTLAGLRGIW